jgi:uncharacterized spore protein YtfJ
MLLAALRGYAGCDVLAMSNWLLHRDDQIGCLVFWPIDHAEHRRTHAEMRMDSSMRLPAGSMGGWRERREQAMEVHEVIGQARDALTVKRVFGEPYEKDGVTIIPAARVLGGAGGGSGEDPQSQGKGSGSGFGMTARPVGAFIIREGELSWRPAVDVTRIVLGGQVVAIVALLTARAILKARAKARN